MEGLEKVEETGSTTYNSDIVEMARMWKAKLTGDVDEEVIAVFSTIKEYIRGGL